MIHQITTQIQQIIKMEHILLYIIKIIIYSFIFVIVHLHLIGHWIYISSIKLVPPH